MCYIQHLKVLVFFLPDICFSELQSTLYCSLFRVYCENISELFGIPGGLNSNIFICLHACFNCTYKLNSSQTSRSQRSSQNRCFVFAEGTFTCAIIASKLLSRVYKLNHLIKSATVALSTPPFLFLKCLMGYTFFYKKLGSGHSTKIFLS